MREPITGPAELQDHIAGTYFALRIGMGILAAALPLLLWLGGRLFDHEPLRCSMSAYYHSPSMRNTFVGVLVAIGVFLYLYQGFSRKENWSLNLAGALAVGVAMVPTGQCGDGHVLSAHGAIAVLFFLAIAYVCIFCASDTLSLVRDTRIAERYRSLYRTLGTLMVVSPLLGVALQAVIIPGGRSSLLFFIETLAVVTFAAYWLTKSRELSATDAERLALERKLRRAARPTGAAAPAPGRLVQVEPD